MRFSLLLLSLSICFAWTGSTAALETSRWDCQISAEMRGSAQHYLYYGRDSWNGEGSLYCESGGQSVFRPVNVSFNAMYDGFGADSTSAVQLLVNMSTSMSPSELQVRAVVGDLDAGPKVAWRFSSELSQADFFVINSTPPAATRSLQSGTLYIRSSGE